MIQSAHLTGAGDVTPPADIYTQSEAPPVQ
jgi:hypothetical protein